MIRDDRKGQRTYEFAVLLRGIDSKLENVLTISIPISPHYAHAFFYSNRALFKTNLAIPDI